ncbi:MAG: hypothetical protein GC168_19825 [Candidatus Hydrogenedens sp.]|nr:hypothetical protein [Candidatus Hydrogenedens sp.]
MCNMPPPTESPASIENELLRQLTNIDKQISDLEAERNAIKRLLIRVRNENVGTKDVTRRNSISRIIIERAIIETINRAAEPVSSKEIYKNINNDGYNLKENTFRSHLHRMKEKGLIEQLYRGGSWRLKPAKA